MKPPMTYFGGKIRIAPQIVDLMPAHGHYVEPYCGSLAVLLAKPQAPHETVNDLDKSLMTFWRVLRDQRDEFQELCELTPHSRAEHAASYETSDDLPDIEVARRVWVQLTQGRAGVRRATGWRHYQDPSRSTGSMPDYLSGYLGRMAPAATRLRAVSLECRPALDVVADYGRHREVLLYVDPPYLGSTRQSGGYVHEMKGDTDHADLIALLLACESAVMLSGYPNDLYESELVAGAGWDRMEIATATGQGGEGQERTEVIWSNRALNTQQAFDLEETAS